MITAWTKNLKSPEDITKFNQAYEASSTVRERLLDLLYEMETEVEATETNPKIYDLPNWDYRQAHTNGYKACIKMVKKLLT